MNVRYTNVMISYRWRSLFRHISRQESWATTKMIARCALYMGDISLSLFLVYAKWPRLWFKGCSDDRCDSCGDDRLVYNALHNAVHCRVIYRELFRYTAATHSEISRPTHQSPLTQGLYLWTNTQPTYVFLNLFQLQSDRYHDRWAALIRFTCV